MSGAEALARIRRSVRDKGVANSVGRALGRVGGAIGKSREDMEELATPDYGIGEDGERRVAFGPYDVRLRVETSRKVTLSTLDTRTGKRTRGMSKAALAHEPANGIGTELRRAAKDIPKLLREVRWRIERGWRTEREWSFCDWHERMIGNALVGTLTRRLIWRFTLPDGQMHDLIWHGRGPLASDGSRFVTDLSNARVGLWHPSFSNDGDVTKWRTLLAMRRICQPFPQAHRPLYVATEAERRTGTYSNRFSGHILEQPVLIAFLRSRGWSTASRVAGHPASDGKPNELRLPRFGVAAQFWVAGVGHQVQEEPHGYAAANFQFVSTDRLVFRPLDPNGTSVDAFVPIEDVPTMALCEAMRDLDQAVGLTSIGNDRFWTDRGARALPPLSNSIDVDVYRREWTRASGMVAERHAFLATIVPSLAIADRLRLEERALTVRGDLHTYCIDLGSSSVRRSPRDQHVCIVLGGAPGPDGGFVPYEGDTILSAILSKAFMLANDRQIADPVIKGQL